MRVLLDTHILIWAITDSERLPGAARSLLLDEGNLSFASTVNIWEMAIKHALRRGSDNDMPWSGAIAFAEIRASAHGLLAIEPEHAVRFDGLPPLHRDPFDRLLIAQAQAEGMRLLTHDAALAPYGDHVLVV